MAAFTLDTSGVVPACAPTADPNILGPCGFHDLSPFAQGYVEALFASAADALNEARISARLPLRRVAFRDLSPEALALILKDCASMKNIATGFGMKKVGFQEGRNFWNGRKAGGYGLSSVVSVAFPPLTPYLSDDGKVCLKEAA